MSQSTVQSKSRWITASFIKYQKWILCFSQIVFIKQDCMFYLFVSIHWQSNYFPILFVEFAKYWRNTFELSFYCTFTNCCGHSLFSQFCILSADAVLLACKGVSQHSHALDKNDPVCESHSYTALSSPKFQCGSGKALFQSNMWMKYCSLEDIYSINS